MHRPTANGLAIGALANRGKRKHNGNEPVCPNKFVLRAKYEPSEGMQLMRIRNTDRPERSKKAKLSMTAMIDIVFLLLVFFIMTFRVVSPEGDFHVNMPRDGPGSVPPGEMPPIHVRLRADDRGKLARIQMGERTVKDFGELHVRIRQMVGDDTGPDIREQTEVVLDCDYNLKFEHMMGAVTAISGYVEDGRIIKVIEKIRFAQPRKA